MHRAVTYELVSLCHTVTFASNICFTPLVLKYVLFLCGLILISPRNILYFQIIGTFVLFNFKVKQLEIEREENNYYDNIIV